MWPRRLLGPLRDDETRMAGWANVKPNQAAPAINGAYNLDAYTDNGAGDYTFTWAVALAATPYAVLALPADENGTGVAHKVAFVEGLGTAATRLNVRSPSGPNLVDANLLLVAVLGRH